MLHLQYRLQPFAACRCDALPPLHDREVKVTCSASSVLAALSSLSPCGPALGDASVARTGGGPFSQRGPQTKTHLFCCCRAAYCRRSPLAGLFGHLWEFTGNCTWGNWQHDSCVPLGGRIPVLHSVERYNCWARFLLAPLERACSGVLKIAFGGRFSYNHHLSNFEDVTWAPASPRTKPEPSPGCCAAGASSRCSHSLHLGRTGFIWPRA